MSALSVFLKLPLYDKTLRSGCQKLDERGAKCGNDSQYKWILNVNGSLFTVKTCDRCTPRKIKEMLLRRETYETVPP